MFADSSLHDRASPGTARIGFRRLGTGKTALTTAFATSPLRLLTPSNHGDASWVFLASLGGGLVDGDRLDVEIEVEPRASALLGTQASTKVYRSAGSANDSTPGCAQRFVARVGEGSALTVIPDPIVCFAGARYEQAIDVTVTPSGSLFLMDGYTCGRSARGERWAFSRYESRTIVSRDDGAGSPASRIVDATRLDPRHGAVADRMRRFDVVVSVIALGPRFATVREAMLAALPPLGSRDSVLAAASSIGDDGCILRVAAERFESASLTLRSSFAALARVLGDDPFARKW